ncbi:phosphoserine phosphatase SerB [Catenovulum sediminis]|uniref:Phosphoserine phosphatase n=1 Tax=Catenovulum sediminis TaxID=1740262 RepID=A0ABV1RLX3_9ALTE|nr:phosphoserine phosphatase SerB [Catenovulum sediminis]
MSQYNIYTADVDTKYTHFARGLYEQVKPDLQHAALNLNPDNSLEYRLEANQKTPSGCEVICYGNAFSTQDFAYISESLKPYLAKDKGVRVLHYEGFETTALAWPAQTKIPADLFNKLHSWASEKKCELWQLSERPTLQQPGLLLMDMDSTTIKIECIDEIAKLAGVGQQVSEVTELAMQGKLDFAESLKGRVGKLAGCDVSVLDAVANNLPLMHGLEHLIDCLKQHHWRVAIASGGFTFFADKLKQQLNLDAAVANTLKIENGVLTGEVVGEIVDANVKARTLGELAEKFDISQTQTIAMGDGANDLTMMAAAALGIAFEAKPIVQQKADVAINHYGLDALIYMLK